MRSKCFWHARRELTRVANPNEDQDIEEGQMGMDLKQRTPKILLWLFVINLGVALGAGVYESRIVFDNWLTSSPDSALHWDAEAARADNTGLRFWAFVTTVPLTLLTLANLVAAWHAVGALRLWWLAAAVAALADRVFTFSYFIPTMVGLMQAPDSAGAVATAMRWEALNYLRHAIVLAAWLASLRAFALLYQTARAFPEHDGCPRAEAGVEPS
jgi:hypothetical protein